VTSPEQKHSVIRPSIVCTTSVCLFSDGDEGLFCVKQRRLNFSTAASEIDFIYPSVR
jgi:hypothetical protein